MLLRVLFEVGFVYFVNIINFFGILVVGVPFFNSTLSTTRPAFTGLGLQGGVHFFFQVVLALFQFAQQVEQGPAKAVALRAGLFRIDRTPAHGAAQLLVAGRLQQGFVEQRAALQQAADLLQGFRQAVGGDEGAGVVEEIVGVHVSWVKWSAELRLREEIFNRSVL